MISVAYYDTTTGEILKRVILGPDDIELNKPEGADWILCGPEISNATHEVDLSGEVPAIVYKSNIPEAWIV